MSKTEVSGKQVKDGSIELVDLSTTLSNTISGKADASSLATVATSGSYDDLSNKPSIPSVAGLASETYVDNAVAGKADSSSLATVATSGAYADLTGKPTLFDGAYSSLSGAPSIPANLDDLSDVTITSPSSEQVLKYNGTAWVNSAAPAAGATNLDGLSDVAVSSAAKGQFIAHNGTNFVNTRTIEADLGTTIPLTIKGASNHTNYLFVTKNSSDTHLVSIIGNGSTFMSVDSASVTNLTISRPASHTKYGLLVRHSNGKRMFGVGSDASIFGEFAGWGASLELGTDDYSLIRLGYHTSTGALRVWSNTDTIQSWESPGGAAGTYLLTLARDTTAGTTSWKFTPSGFATNINFATKVGVNVSAEPGAQFQVNAAAAATKGMIVKGAASQTANLFEAQNSAGTALFTINSSGDAVINGIKAGINGVSSATVFAADTATAMTGADNTFVGYQAGKGTTSGYANVVLGSQAYNNASSATSYQNICIGTYAGNAANVKTQMVIIGTAAQARGGGTAGIAIGHVAEAGNKAIAIGYGAVAENDSLELKWGGNSTSTYAGKINGNSSGAVSVTGDFHAKRYTETVANAFNTSLAPSTGTLTVDTSTGNAVLGTLSASVTTWAFTNVPTDNSKVTTITAVIAGNASYTYGDACSVNGSAVTNGIMWSGGYAPTSTAGTDIITFVIVKDSAGTVKVFGSATTNFS